MTGPGTLRKRRTAVIVIAATLAALFSGAASGPAPAEAHSLSQTTSSSVYGRARVCAFAGVDHPSTGGAAKAARSANPESSNCGRTKANNIVDTSLLHRNEYLANGTWTRCYSRDYGWTGTAPGSLSGVQHLTTAHLKRYCYFKTRRVQTVTRAQGRWNDGTVKSVWAYSGGHPAVG